MDMKRRDFLKMTAALAAAGVSPSLLAAGKEQFTVYGAPAMPSVTIAVAALQGKLAKQADVSLKVWRSPDQLRAGVASGQFKVMMSPSNVGVNLRNQGQKVGMVNILTNGITQLVCKGSAIASLPLKEIVLSKRIYLVAFLRLMLIPLILLMFVKVSGIAHLGGHSDTVVLISFLATVSPAASTVTQMAMVYGQNARKASAIYGITTLLCVITMPLMIALYQAMV